MRAYYDKYGREANKSGGPDAEVQMDMAKMFFAVMFGGDKFEPYIGQLGLSAVVDVLAQEMQGKGHGGGGAHGLDIKEMKKVQLKREVACAVELAKRLQPFVDGDAAGFAAFVATEVSGMAKATFGEPLLHAIGEAYEVAADKWLGYKLGFLGLEGFAAQMKQSANENWAYLGVASMGFKSLGKMAEMQEIAEAGKKRELEGPLPPSDAALAAQQASYGNLSVRELKDLMAARPKDPARAPDPVHNPLGLPTAGFAEKGDFVLALLAHDAASLAAATDAHAAWKLGGMEGPSPAAPLMAEQRRKAKAAKAAAEKAAAKEKAAKEKAAAAASGGAAEDTKAADDADTKGEDSEESAAEEAAKGMFGDGMNDESAAEMNKAMESSLPVFMQTMVAASLLDVEITLRDVCKKVLGDHGVPLEQRVLRAKALKLLGKAFLKAKGTSKAARGELDAKHVLEGTMSKTMAKAQGQEVHDDDDQELFDNIASMHEDAEHGEEGKGQGDRERQARDKDGGEEGGGDGEAQHAAYEAQFEARMAEAVAESTAVAAAESAKVPKKTATAAAVTPPPAPFADDID